MKLNVLIACEESQAECMAFRELGHNAYSCDIQPCKPGGNPYWHIQGDVTPLLNGDTAFKVQAGFLRCVDHWDLIIAHPPCTYLCKMGAVQLIRHISPLEDIPPGWIVDFNVKTADNITIINADRLRQLRRAREFFLNCLNTKAAHYVAIENPLPMARANLPQPSFYIDPSWFGVKYTKKTLYWVKNLPPIMPEIINPRTKQYVRSSRGKYRSRTFPQVAQALARQWSEFIFDDIAKKK